MLPQSLPGIGYQTGSALWEMHRFIPAMSTVAGARITEIVVTHHPRRFGKSKYGLGRVWRVMLDIIAFKFIISVFAPSSKPQKLSLLQRLSDVLFNPKQKVFRAAALLSLPFFILGRVLSEMLTVLP